MHIIGSGPMDARDHIEQIRSAIDAVEVTVESTETSTEVLDWDALELPGIITSIVDYLQPQLTTYEAALYWHMFRHSVLGNGTQYVRVGVRGVRNAVVVSSSGQSDTLSYQSVNKALGAMESKRVIV